MLADDPCFYYRGKGQREEAEGNRPKKRSPSTPEKAGRANCYVRYLRNSDGQFEAFQNQSLGFLKPLFCGAKAMMLGESCIPLLQSLVCRSLDCEPFTPVLKAL